MPFLLVSHDRMRCARLGVRLDAILIIRRMKVREMCLSRKRRRRIVVLLRFYLMREINIDTRQLKTTTQTMV